MVRKNIDVEEIQQTPVELRDVELVERKGIGHPDSVADGIAEEVSRHLCKEYLKRYGCILHHNTDETQIVAGRSAPRFGGGEVISPVYILITGRATKFVGDDFVPTDVIAIKAAKEYLRRNILNLDVEEHVVIESRLGEGSFDLKNIFGRKKEIPLSNDTSFGVGFAPLSETERIVLNVERKLMEHRFKEKAIGEDVKVMGLRVKDKISLTIAGAIVSKYVSDLEEYKAVKEEIKNFVTDVASEFTEKKVEVEVNTGDDYSIPSVYLTVTGTSMEMGDDGSVGRGNRCNGLITPGRPMSMEATSGKNPVNHIGKIYNLLANQIANDIVEAIDGIEEVYVRILSEIGKPINEPKIASAQVIMKKGYEFENVKKKIEAVIEEWLDEIEKITEMVIEGKLRTF
ncbi:MAG: methionine adenosyltransferase [Archaeoglobi archaeon]|nr:methionine adenosyltransferase [Candidatus Mnemosynella bozhongmuii]